MGTVAYGTVVGHGSEDHKVSKIQDKSDESWTQNHQNKESHEGLPNISTKLLQEVNIKS